MSRVYFVPASAADSDQTLARKITALWARAGLAHIFEARDLVAVKLHVGEPGRVRRLQPNVIAPLVRCIGATGADPFLTDSAVLYKSPRDNAVGHLRTAIEHGFTVENTGAPFFPADGLNGDDEVVVPFAGGKYYQEISIASAIMHARSMLVVSHATGHLATGLGGALKNLGMGCSSKKAKLRQHHGQNPRVDQEACTACSTCAHWCPSDAITLHPKALIDDDKCIGCGECIAVCLDNAVEFRWSIGGRQLQERTVEHAAAVARAKEGRIAYITAAIDITKDCDCMASTQEPVTDDIGILASTDPVAIDRALLDLVKKRSGKRLEHMCYPKRDPLYQIRYGEELGLGENKAKIVQVDA